MNDKNKIKNPNMEEWRCLSCYSKLGYVESKKIIRIKRRDLFIELDIGEDGYIKLNCCLCGKQNTLNAEKEGGD